MWFIRITGQPDKTFEIPAHCHVQSLDAKPDGNELGPMHNHTIICLFYTLNHLSSLSRVTLSNLIAKVRELV